MFQFGETIANRTRDLAALLLVVSVLLNFANVIGRSIFNAPLEWGEEVLLFFMVAIVFLGGVRVSWRGTQIAMDVIVEALPTKTKRIARSAVMLIEILVALAIVVIGVPVIMQLWAYDQRSQASETPLAIPQALIPLGFLLIAIVTFLRFVQTVRRSRMPAVEASSRDGAVSK